MFSSDIQDNSVKLYIFHTFNFLQYYLETSFSGGIPRFLSLPVSYCFQNIRHLVKQQQPPCWQPTLKLASYSNTNRVEGGTVV